MCGIFGIVGPTTTPLAELAAVMERALAHRGPDDVGVYVDGEAMLGNRRLAIIDIAHGHQPVFSEDKQTTLVQNGEIYNYVELRDELKARGVTFHTDSDTEVLLRMYEAYGTGFVAPERYVRHRHLGCTQRRDAFVARPPRPKAAVRCAV